MLRCTGKMDLFVGARTGSCQGIARRVSCSGDKYVQGVATVKKKTIFRESALDQLSSPDQLDQAMRVTSPRQWIALLACLGIIIMVIAWGIFGRIPSKIEARGILIKSGGIATILAGNKGQITTLYIEKDELIDKGQIVARLDQAELVDELNLARKKLEEMERQFWLHKRLKSREGVEGGAARVQQRHSLENDVETSERRIRAFVQQIGEEEKLAKRGLITREKMTATWKKLEGEEKNIKQCVSDVLRLTTEKVEEEIVEKSETFRLNSQIEDMKRDIFSMELRLDLFSKITSPFTGRVVDIQSGIGDLVQPGDQLITLEKAGKDVQDLELVLYVSPMDGKKVKNNMLVQISPSTVKREEYGYMIGMVTQVSTYPSSQKSMMQILNNKELVTMFSQGSAPVAIRANLIPAQSPSGFKWSSSQGPPLQITTGTLCTASITLRRRRPIFFVMPGLERLFSQNASQD